MNMKILLFCFVVMTIMGASKTAYVHAQQAGADCALTEDELDETLGGLDELGLLVKQMESLLKDAVRRRR